MLSRDKMASGNQISPDASQADLQRLTSYSVDDSDSEHIGKVSSIWVDRSAHVAFVGVQTGFLSGKTHVVPAQGATVNDDDQKIRLAYLKSDIKNAPVFDPDAELNYANESEVVSYYRKKGPPLPELKGAASTTYTSASGAAAPAPVASTAAAGTALAGAAAAGSALTGSAAAAPTTGLRESKESMLGQNLKSEALNEANIPLHEEQLRVSKREVGAGMIHLHKIIRTERVEQGVDLRHEEIVVERIPAKDLKVGAKAFQDEEFYIPLRQEEVVIEKQARVREQFHAHKAGKMEHKTIADDVRKEDIQVINENEIRSDLRSDQRARPE